MIGLKFIIGYYNGMVYPMGRLDLFKPEVKIIGFYSMEWDLFFDWGILVALGACMLLFGLKDVYNYLRKNETIDGGRI